VVGGRTNLTLSHPDCNQQAGLALWLKVRREPDSRTAEKGPVTPEFWYQDLMAAAPSSRVPRPSETFQIISAIERGVTIAEGSSIRELDVLVREFGEGRWLKRKGQAVIRMSDGTVRRAELHWYEAHGIGRRYIRIKRYLTL
jgi:hypothetical protein